MLIHCKVNKHFLLHVENCFWDFVFIQNIEQQAFAISNILISNIRKYTNLPITHTIEHFYLKAGILCSVRPFFESERQRLPLFLLRFRF